MPLFMHYSDTDADVARLPEGVSGCDVCGEFATAATPIGVT
jgi:hypothetical protein